MSYHTIAACLMLALALFSTASTGHNAEPESLAGNSQGDKPVITRQDDLPRHSYQLTTTVADLYLPKNRPVLLQLARAVEADILQDLADYDIRDNNTVQRYYSVLGTVAILQNRWQDYLEILAKRRALETKQANRLTMGLYGEALAKAQLAHTNRQDALRTNLQNAVATLDYAIVGDNIKSAKGRTEILTRALILGNLASSYQAGIEKSGGQISYDIASTLVSVSFSLDHFVNDAPILNKIYSAYIAANEIKKPDIWAARKVQLSPNTTASPVTVAIWDSGLDTSIPAFTPLLWRNSAEIADNNLDDDSNGYVDDIHGIAYDLHSKKEVSLLYPIGDVSADPLTLQAQIKGLGDIQSNIDSTEASALRKQLAALQQDQVKNFIESISVYGNYAHGTHVAGIAAEGNPFIRILTARMTYGHTMIPEEPTIKQAQAEAKMVRETIAYFKANGVRAVNMSWGGSLRGVEDALEANNAGGTPEQRKRLARQIFTIGDTALRESIHGAQDILFVTAAGNSDNDVKFDEFYPSGYDYPNMISVGAVDAAGDETSFTSLGKVDIYANGFEVESYVPGGNRIRFNGTSMASPQVLNLAAKLLALRPDLSTGELRKIILEAADEKRLKTRTIKLMNPGASMARIQ